MSVVPITSAPPVLELGAHSTRVALVLADGTTLTYAELEERVSARAREWGAERRLVLVEGANQLEPLVSYLAALNHGHVALVVPGDNAEHVADLAARYDPDILCTTEAVHIVRARSAHALHPDLALLLSTSGSTGSPKLVRLSRAAVASNAAAIAGYLELGPDDRAMTTLPLHYCYGLSVLHSHLHAGSGLVLTDASVVDPGFWQLLDAAGATSFAGVPYTFDLLERSGFAERVHPDPEAGHPGGGPARPRPGPRLGGAGSGRGLGPGRDVRADRGDGQDGLAAPGAGT